MKRNKGNHSKGRGLPVKARVRESRRGYASPRRVPEKGANISARGSKTPKSASMDIDEIQIGTRYRQDPGDLRPLTNSIVEVGLLHPIVVDRDGRLIAGHRRIQAFQSLGLTHISGNHRESGSDHPRRTS